MICIQIINTNLEQRLGTKVIEKTTQNNIYEFDETLQESDVKIADSNKFLIDNNINIDYQKYDAIIKKIISTYDLNNVNCKTVITMYIDILDENDKIKNTSSMSVNIPLNVKTVNVEVENNIDSSEEKIFIESQTVKSSSRKFYYINC